MIEKLKKINWEKVNIVFTIFVFVALASLDNAVVGIFPPLFSSIAEDLKIKVSQLGVVTAVSLFVTSFSSLFWGYLADKGRRRMLIIVGTIFWSVSVYLTAFSKTYIELILYQAITGLGLGCISSIGFSVMTDYIPQKYRGMLMSLWGMSQGFGGIAGSVMASVIAPAASWRRPFIIIAALGLIFTVLYLFIKEPKKGGAEPELLQLYSEGMDYNYSIDRKQIIGIVKKKSNIWLILQGFFQNMTTGTLIWLPTLYSHKIMLQGYSAETAIIASGYLYALLQLGGLFSFYFGYLGDKFQRLTYRARPILASWAIFIAIPLYLIMFMIPMNNLNISHSTNPVLILVTLIKEIFTNPWMFAMFILAIGATTAQSANLPNWLALITDVNLPENRGTAFSIANLISGAGRSFGNILLGWILAYMTTIFKAPENYIITMMIFQVFFIPAALSYVFMFRTSSKDIRTVKSLLKKRARQR